MTERRKKQIGLGLAAIWIAFALGGSIAMYQHAYSGDHAEFGKPQWPSLTTLERDAARPTLVVFAHPKCPCTRATFDSLTQVVEQTDCATTVVFWQPAASSKSDPNQWRSTPIVAMAERIQSIHVVMDPSGVESTIFGANTSGHCMAYSATGELLYSGGITSSRGHTGNNVGLESLIQAIQSGEAKKSLPVFGCTFRQ